MNCLGLRVLAAVTATLSGLSVLGATVHYVDINSTNAIPPFDDWSKAATNVQDAIDQAVAGDEVIVNDGVYATGERTFGTNSLLNRAVVDKALTLRSVNGPEVTTIQGHQVSPSTNGVG